MNRYSKQLKILFLLFLCMGAVSSMSAQADLTKSKSSPVGIKTNIIYWGTATFNAGVEFRLAPKWTLDLEAGLNPFDGKKDDGSYGKSLKHLRVHPEVRYWFCEAFHKHFLGLHVPYLLYNVSDIKLASVTVTRGFSPTTGTSRPLLASVISISNRRNTH